MITGNTELITFLLFVSVVATAYFTYRVIISDYLSNRLRINTGSATQVFLHRISGVVLFGIYPFLVLVFQGMDFESFGLHAPVLDSYLYTLLLSLVILPVSYYSARTPENLQNYPQIRNEVWSLKMLIASALSWSAYLVAYEFMVRGFLLYSSISYLGLWPAIIVNTIIYSLLHLHKGIREMVASVPLGIVLCYLTFLTGNIWTAVFAHIVMALSNEWFSLYLNPSIEVKRVKK